MEFQKTLKKPISFEGIGLHSGKATSIVINPAPANHGIIFKKNETLIPASVDYVSSTKRGTTLSKDNSSIQTVEHLLSALRGLGIDNALIQVDGEEIPAMDGSAAKFTQAIAQAGIENLSAARSRWTYKTQKPFVFTLGNSSYKLLPSENLALSVSISYPNTPIGIQEAGFLSTENYAESIAKARTFCLESELAMILSNGLGQGGSLDNAIVVGAQNIQSSEPLRYKDEFVRHKILDLIGDLALIGSGEFCFNLSSFAPSHHGNVALARELKNKLTLEEPGGL